MKVLFVHHDSIQSGSGRCLYEFLSQLKKEDGIEPIVLVHNKNSLYDAVKKMGIETYYCRFGYTCCSNKLKKYFFFWGKIYRPLANILAYLYLKIRIDLKNIDVIHSNSMIIDFGAYLHRKIDKPLVWHLREFWGRDVCFIPFEKNFSKYIMENSIRVMTVSNAVRDFLTNDSCDKSKVVCVYDGVVCSSFKKSKSVLNDKLKIVMSGRFSEEKRQILALKALLKLEKEDLNKIELDFFGSGAKELELKSFVEMHGLSSVVNFRGFCSNLNERLCEYDLGLNLTTIEGFGRTTVEYMLSGLYVIATNKGASPELLDYGKYGALVNDEDALVRELVFAIHNRNECFEKAKLGEMFARSRFDIEKNYKKIVETIKNGTIKKI